MAKIPWTVTPPDARRTVTETSRDRGTGEVRTRTMSPAAAERRSARNSEKVAALLAKGRARRAATAAASGAAIDAAQKQSGGDTPVEKWAEQKVGEKKESEPKTLQAGKRGGQYYLSASGKKIYVR